MLDLFFQFAMELARALLVDGFSSAVRRRVIRFLVSRRERRTRMGWKEIIRRRNRYIHRLPTEDEEDL
jgi:hypothetical protein